MKAKVLIMILSIAATANCYAANDSIKANTKNDKTVTLKKNPTVKGQKKDFIEINNTLDKKTVQNKNAERSEAKENTKVSSKTESSNTDSESSNTLLIIILIVAAYFLGKKDVFSRKKKKQENKNTDIPKNIADKEIITTETKDPEDTIEPSKKEETLQEEKPTENADSLTPVVEKAVNIDESTSIEETSTTEDSTTTEDVSSEIFSKTFASENKEWIVIGASVQGNGHISQNIPCQDACAYKYLGNGWGIAVTSDGAGSAANSQIGSKIASERAIFHYENLINSKNWMLNSSLPESDEWMRFSYKATKAVHDDLMLYAKKKDFEFKSLSATLIVVIHTPLGLLVNHVGDGRAGYMDENEKWHAIITPHKGEEINQTLFLTSDFWDIPFFEISGTPVPETRIITSPVKAITLMSDGCENTAWLYNQYNGETEKYYDPNIPYAPFLTPLVKTLHKFREANIPLENRKEKWESFIRNGNASFVKETDDKTMVLIAKF